MTMKSDSDAEASRVRVSQSDIPNLTLAQSLKIAQAIWENFAGKGSAPHNVAMALDLSPTSGGWRNLCGASIAYGLTEGGYNANTIVLTDLGRRIVAPTKEGDELSALKTAALMPRVPNEFFSRYNRAKFPRDDIAANVLVEMGIPKDRAPSLVELIKENGRFVKFIRDTKTGLFVALDGADETVGLDLSDENTGSNDVTAFNPLIRNMKLAEDQDSIEGGNTEQKKETPTPNNKVFITHGRNQQIMDQIKKVVVLGGFEPVIAMQRETAARPVPQKVMEDMRLCGAAVIHVGSEGILKDEEGHEYPQINPNVLIEIGAAMALYKDRFILVVEEGVTLPSNLQGLYESRYRGDVLDLESGMRILEALRGLSAKKKSIDDR